MKREIVYLDPGHQELMCYLPQEMNKGDTICSHYTLVEELIVITGWNFPFQMRS